MIDRVRLAQQLREDEGRRLRPYGDLKGKITIGYGRNLTDRGISIEEAEILLQNDIDLVVAAVRANWAPFDSLDPVRQEVLVNMGFNLGVGGLLTFKEMLHHAAIGDYHEAASDMERSLWAQQVGPRAQRLADAMRTGAFIV